MRKILFLVALLMSVSAARAEITVAPSTPIGKKIEAVVKPTVPEGAEWKGRWRLPNCDTEPKGSDRLLIWATSGKHVLEYRGTWMTFELIDVPQVDGTIKKVKSVVDWDTFEEQTTFEVTGGVKPPDPPQPQGKFRVVMFYSEDQLESLPWGQRNVLQSLAFREWLSSEGHVLMEPVLIDPKRVDSNSAKWKPWIQAILNDPLPRICIAPKDEAGYVADYAVPQSIEDAQKLIRDPATWKAVRLQVEKAQ